MSDGVRPHKNNGFPIESASSDSEHLESDPNLDFDETEVSADVAELTAYLDGELEPTLAFQIESRLNSDPQYLAEMQGLQKAWDLLDYLPSPSSSNDFVRTTMELVAADVVKQQKSVRSPLNWLWKGIAFLLIPFCLMTISYAASRAWRMLPHQTLIENFDLIENLEKYQRIDSSLDFLIRLNDLELFSDELASSYRATGSDHAFDFSMHLSENDAVENLTLQQDPEKSLEQIQQKIASLEPDMVAALQKNFEKFEAMSPSEIDKLRSFHDQLKDHPDSQRLQTVLNAYDDWLKRLGMSDSHGGAATVAEILDSSLSDRLKMVARVRSDQIREALGRWGATKLLNDRDVDVLLNWFDLSINTNQAEIRNQFAQVVFPEYLRQQGITNRFSTQDILRTSRRLPIRRIVAFMFRIDRQAIENIIFQDINLLLHALSPEARWIISEYHEAQQKELVMNWIDAGIQAKANIPEERLQVFYESLPAAKRDELDQMSIEDWNANLTRMYWDQNEDSVLFRDWQIEVFGNQLFR